MNAFTPTLNIEIELRRDNYYLISAPPKRIGDRARIFVQGMGEKNVMLCETDGVVYCSTWLVDTDG